ncbi:MAG TPA: hypothetical protein VHL59_16035 [Thermoanaerobaculia bacterium]|nr:hypothetical protein [Thermoanaerobaculia bacterium]
MSRLTLAFVGQCHTVGYEGVPADAAFPEVCRGVIQASRPEVDVQLLVEPYYHPVELAKATRTVLAQAARVVIVEVVGWLAVSGSEVVDLSRLPRGVRSAYQRAQHLRRVARAVAKKTPQEAGLIHTVRTSALSAASTLLRPLLPRAPRPTVAQYEHHVADALATIRAHGATPVVQGPGAPNLALDSRRMPSDALDRYRSVHQMARRVAEGQSALYVDRWDTVAGGFFIPGTVRPTAGGHSVWGHLLGRELLNAGIV